MTTSEQNSLRGITSKQADVVKAFQLKPAVKIMQQCFDSHIQDSAKLCAVEVFLDVLCKADTLRCAEIDHI